MYITADGETVVREELSIESMDVLKSGEIISETPLGRMYFSKYFEHVETEISNEVASRKSDIADCRAQMARDFAFNAAARAKLKRDMLHKMAINARIAKRNLDRFMRKTQLKMAHYAHLQNRRNKRNLARDKRTLKHVKRDKRQNEHHLKLAVSAWQKATSAWAASTNARISRLNAHAAANAANIKENAKKARKDLDNAMHTWDHKVASFSTEAKNARNKLSAQFAAQGKATRAWANNKIKGLVAQTASQFNDVETKMAKNRQAVDLAVKHAVIQAQAAMNAEKALEKKRFAEVTADIVHLKAETKAKVRQMKAQFKVALLSLSSTVKTQVNKVNNRIDGAAGVVRSNSAKQAKINSNVNAEMTRMIKLGNDQYKKHLMAHEKLAGAIAKDKRSTDKELDNMAKTFNSHLAAIRKELKAERAHAESKLKKQTAGVYSKLYANQAAQKKKNAKMEAETRRMELDAMDNIREAKKQFIAKIHKLAKVVAHNDKKADKGIKKLTGVVTKNAAKSAAGRNALRMIENSNKDELSKSIDDAIQTGEKRARAVEAKGAKMDKDTHTLINLRLNSEITKLRDETNASVESLALQSKEARMEMRKEMLYAIRSAADVAKSDLEDVIRTSTKRMIKFEADAAKTEVKSGLARKALKDEIAANAKAVKRMIQDAVATDARAQAALSAETAKSLKKTNKSLSASAKQMKADFKAARAAIKAQESQVLGKIAKETAAATKLIKKAASKDAERQKAALTFMAKELVKAGKASDLKFGKAYEKLADDREHAESTLGNSVKGLNDALAKQAALEDVRFEKSVKDIKKARKQAADQVAALRQDFSVALIDTTALAKNVENKLVSLTEKASGEVISFAANQAKVNRRVKKEKKRIEEIANTRFSEDKRARGRLKMLMDENKAAASAEVKELSKSLDGKLSKLRATNAHNKRAMAKDLSDASETFYEQLGDAQAKDAKRKGAINGATAAAAAEAAQKMKVAKAAFGNKIMGLTDIVTANANHAKAGMKRVTGLTNDIAKASAHDRKLIKDEIRSLESDLNKALDRAISIGEAKAKAVAQRIAEHQKGVKRFLQVELGEQLEAAADKVLLTLQSHRQRIADNYLSLKAYAIGSQDKVQGAVAKGHGKALSSIGDLLQTVGNLGEVQAPMRAGPGMGGDTLPTIFSGKTVIVSKAVNVINGLVDEYSEAVGQVRNRWPMGLGKYLLDKLELSMPDKGVLQVDKVAGKNGNFVYVNGRSVGLSNKLGIFETLALRMVTYESVLAKLTSKIVKKPVVKAASMKSKEFFVPGAEWEGN